MEDVDQFKTSGLDGVKEGDQYVREVIKYETTFVVNVQPVALYFYLQGVACNTIFSWALLKKTKA